MQQVKCEPKEIKCELLAAMQDEFRGGTFSERKNKKVNWPELGCLGILIVLFSITGGEPSVHRNRSQDGKAV